MEFKTVDLGNLITIGVILLTALFNYIRSKTKIESKLEALESQIKKQNSRVSKLEDYNIHHLEDCHKK